MSLFLQMAQSIVKEQELVIGPLAWSEAAKVRGLRVVPETKQIALTDPDQKGAIDRLVAQYERLFGRASQEVCKDAVQRLIASLPRADVPASLLA